MRPQVILDRRGTRSRLVPGSAIVEVVRFGIALELAEELERFVPRMVESDQLAVGPLIGGILLFVHVPKRKDKEIDFLQCSHLNLLDSGILKTLNHVPEVDVGDFMRQDELKEHVLVLADESEQSTRQVDMASGMGERVDGLGIEDGEGVFDVFSRDSCQQRLGRRVNSLPPGSAGRGWVEAHDHVVQLFAEAHLILVADVRQFPARLDLRLAPVWVEFREPGVRSDGAVRLAHGVLRVLWCDLFRLSRLGHAGLGACGFGCRRGRSGSRSGSHCVAPLSALWIRCSRWCDNHPRHILCHLGALADGFLSYSSRRLGTVKAVAIGLAFAANEPYRERDVKTCQRRADCILDHRDPTLIQFFAGSSWTANPTETRSFCSPSLA